MCPPSLTSRRPCEQTRRPLCRAVAWRQRLRRCRRSALWTAATEKAQMLPRRESPATRNTKESSTQEECSQMATTARAPVTPTRCATSSRRRQPPGMAPRTTGEERLTLSGACQVVLQEARLVRESWRARRPSTLTQRLTLETPLLGMATVAMATRFLGTAITARTEAARPMASRQATSTKQRLASAAWAPTCHPMPRSSFPVLGRTPPPQRRRRRPPSRRRSLRPDHAGSPLPRSWTQSTTRASAGPRRSAG
mmetsp:Transcript_78690/g.197693  ORF Transcript_78690/g.197693 Transcript_78690/m.197693 type:complete len:253 (-) Transcript_78690:31-789(-)